MRVRALKAHMFDGRTRAPADEYEMSGRYLKVARQLGWAEEIPPASYETRMVEEPKAKRKYVRKQPYKRRDMRAED